MDLKIGKKRVMGNCPICGEPLVFSYGITRCSSFTCDHVEYDKTDADVEAAGQAILRGEHARGDRARLLDRLPRFARRSRSRDSLSDQTTCIMSDPSKDPLENGKVRET